MKNKFLLIIVYSIISFVCYSQQTSSTGYTIEGIVYDSTLVEPIEMATIALNQSKDSTFIQGSGSDKKGFFILKNVKPASCQLSISYVGYKTKVINITEKSFTTTKLNLGRINLQTSDIQLSSIVITAEVPELVVKEDTLEYNAAAFRLTESAVVEDLLKRLPGVEVDSEGKISTSTGKEVKRVFVDGKEFFGNDPKMATKNLNADMVDKVQVVEKKSDLAILTGVEDDDPETIINITIKKGMKKGWMGNIAGGMGGIIENTNNEDMRYNANSNVNRFTEQDQFSFIANANNINSQASTDRSNNVRAGRGQGGGSGNGIISSNAFGVNMYNIINDKLKFGGNVTYNYRDNNSKNNSFRQNIFADSVSYRSSSSHDRTYSNNFSFDGKLEYKPDSATTMIFTPSFSYNSSSSSSGSFQKTMAGDIDSSLVNESNSSNSLKSDGIQFRLQFDVSRKLSNTGRRASFSGWFNINNSDGDGRNNSENIFYRNPDRNQIYDQKSKTSGNRSAYNLRLTYVEPVGKGNFINFSYNIQVNETKNRRSTLDFDSLDYEYSILNPDYSKSSDTRSVSHNIRANFNSHKTNYSYNIGISVSPDYTDSKSFIKDWHGDGRDSIVNDPKGRHATNYSPFLDFTYRFNSDRTIRRNIRFRYNGRSNQPTVTQLDPTEDNTNPLNIRSGNPNLLPSFNNTISLELNNSNRETQKSLTARVSHTFVRNQIINYTEYEEETGIQHTSPINENGTWNSSANILLAMPLDSKKRVKFSSRSNISYRNQVGYSMVNNQSERNITKTLDLAQNLTLSYSNDWYYGQIRGSIRYSNSNYSLEGISRKESYNYNLTYNLQLTLPLNLTAASDISYTGNSGLSAGYNKNEVIWNAELSKQFLKRKQGSLRFQITDILQQRVNIRRTVNDRYIQDTEYNTLSSYFIVSFTYRFNNVGGKRDNNRRRSESRDDGSYSGEGNLNRERGERGMGGRSSRNF